MGAIFRLVVSSVRIFLVTFCVLEDLLNYIQKFQLGVMLSLIILMFLGVSATVAVQIIDDTQALPSNLINIGCYYFMLLLHILLCVKFHKSPILGEFLTVKLPSALYTVQILMHLLVLICTYLLFIDQITTSVKIAATLSICSIEALLILYIILQKVHKYIR
jgi:hypothetical protein